MCVCASYADELANVVAGLSMWLPIVHLISKFGCTFPSYGISIVLVTMVPFWYWQPHYASRRSRTRDTVKLTVCVSVCVCVCVFQL